jgi:hypothetical protein
MVITSAIDVQCKHIQRHASRRRLLSWRRPRSRPPVDRHAGAASGRATGAEAVERQWREWPANSVDPTLIQPLKWYEHARVARAPRLINLMRHPRACLPLARQPACRCGRPSGSRRELPQSRAKLNLTQSEQRAAGT